MAEQTTATKMAVVSRCGASECAYNHDGKCCTMAITVGGPEPRCDTFFSSSNKGGNRDIEAGVGSCKVSGCVFNKGFECVAEGIKVEMQAAQPMCSTYTAR